MRVHKKAAGWVRDVGAIARGGFAATVYRKPPKHYLGFTKAGKVPVILIPGVFSPWGSMKHLADRISLLGHPVYIVPDLKKNIYAVPRSAKIVRSLVVQVVPKRGRSLVHAHTGAATVRKFIEKEDIRGAIIVAHSKGGLIGKYLLTHYNADRRVLGMVAIATPFSGSKMAQLVPHDSFRELLEDSKIVHDLEANKTANDKIISVFPEYDTHVWHPKGSFLDGAENIEVPTQGHHSILFSKKGGRVALAAIEKMTQKG